jgi:hypothetical protein
MFATKVYAAEPQKIDELFLVVDNVLDKITPVAVILTVIMFIVGGYMWIISAGNPDSIKKAQGTMTWAVIGFVFIFLSKSILKLVVDFLG